MSVAHENYRVTYDAGDILLTFRAQTNNALYKTRSDQIHRHLSYHSAKIIRESSGNLVPRDAVLYMPLVCKYRQQLFTSKHQMRTLAIFENNTHRNANMSSRVGLLHNNPKQHRLAFRQSGPIAKK